MKIFAMVMAGGNGTRLHRAGASAPWAGLRFAYPEERKA